MREASFMTSLPQNESLDELMTRLDLSNADLVKASTEQLTFKQVQKARKGRAVTPNIQKKIANALQTAIRAKQ